MLEFLAGNWIYTLLGIIAIVAIIYVCVKYEGSRVYIYSFLGIALVAVTIYSGIQLNAYYNTSGGIFGAITGIFNTNTVEVENLSFSLSNIEMTQESDDTYSAKVLTNKSVASLDAGEEYTITINGQPCTDVNYTTDYVSATYEYSFLDENFVELCHDTLSINIAFHNNGTNLSVSTSGGADAVKYWNYFFQKENFVIEIKISDYKASEYEYVDSDGVSFVTYYVNGEEYLTKPCITNSVLKLADCDLENFYCWSLTDGENWANVGKEIKVTDSINLYAIFVSENIVTFNSPFGKVEDQFISDGGYISEPTAPINEDYTFDGYYIDGVEIDFASYEVTSDVTVDLKYTRYELTEEEKEILLNSFLDIRGVNIVLDYVGQVEVTGSEFTSNGNYFGFLVSNTAGTSIKTLFFKFDRKYSSIHQLITEASAVVKEDSFALSTFTSFASTVNGSSYDYTQYAPRFIDYYNSQTGSNVTSLDDVRIYWDIGKSELALNSDRTRFGEFVSVDFVICVTETGIYIDDSLNPSVDKTVDPFVFKNYFTTFGELISALTA